jgi:hypothetical protein
MVGYLTHTSGMSTIDHLAAVANRYIAQTGSKPTTLVLHALDHTTKLAAPRSGRDIQVRFADASFQWFALGRPAEQTSPAILLEWRQANFPHSLRRSSSRSQNLTDGPGGA